MAIIKSNKFAKYNVVTGAGNYNLPMDDVTAVYGPGWPIAPVPRPEDSDLPREIDYPVAINATLQPRVGYSGLMPVSALKAAYTQISEVSTPVNIIIRELAGFRPMLKAKDTKQLASGHPYAWMTTYPDRVTPFNVWLSKFKKSAKVYAAPAFFLRRDGSGGVDALEYIDGSTLFLIINSRGRLPMPDEIDPEVSRYMEQIRYGTASNDKRASAGIPLLAQRYLEKARERVKQGKELPTTTPAFTQIIKGIPFSFWDKSQVYFVPDPPSPAVDSPYGETYIERSMTWIQIIAMLTAFELGHYRTGNMPEGFATMPKEWFPTMAKLALAEREFNARMASGTQTEHARIRFGPDGMKYIPTKKPDFPDKLYTYARHNIYYALGMPTSEIGERSSRGLGGKGFEQGAAHDVSRQILEAEKRSVEDAMNWVLEQNGVDDVEFYMDYPQEEIDPTLQQTALWNQLMHGTMTLNDVLTAQNKKPIGNIDDKENLANMHLFVAGSTIFVIEKMTTDERGAVSRMKEATPKALPKAGGSPKNEESDVVPEEDRKRNPSDEKTLAKFIQDLEVTGGGSFGGKFYSIASMSKAEVRPEPTVAVAQSTMVALEVPHHIAVKLREIVDRFGTPPGSTPTPPQDMHLTLAMMGDVSREEAFGPVKRCAQTVANLHRPNVGTIQGFGVFNGDGESVLYASLDCPDLPEIRQMLCSVMDSNGVAYSRDHGFTPHITLAYFPEGWSLPAGFSVPTMEMSIHRLYIYHGPEKESVSLNPGAPELVKVDWDSYKKHCGVCEGDEEYFGAPISRKAQFANLPDHSNQVEFISMKGEGMAEIPALWKPEGGEDPRLVAKVGGPQYLREEATWLLGQSLGFPLVPLAYVSSLQDGERGAATWFVDGGTPDLSGYSPEYISKAAILDYISGQMDRGSNGHNYITHPEDTSRMVLIDNGMSFPTSPSAQARSIFVEKSAGSELSDELVKSIEMCLGDASTWNDIREVLSGSGDAEGAIQAVSLAKDRAKKLTSDRRMVK